MNLYLLHIMSCFLGLNPNNFIAYCDLMNGWTFWTLILGGHDNMYTREVFYVVLFQNSSPLM